MKVLLTGATGFVGQEVLRQLHEKGHATRILVRSRQKVQQLLSRFACEAHEGDILEARTLAEGLRGMEAVIHLVGIISEIGQNTFENIHTRGTQNLVAAAQQTGVKRFVHMSALGTRPGAVSRYHQSKWQAEEAVRQSGLAYTIFRPSLIYGPRDHFVNLFAQIIGRSPLLPIMGPGTARFQPVSVEAVARAFVAALDEPRAIGQTYDLCGPETFTFAELLDEILAVMERKRIKLKMPLPLARAQAGLLEFVFPRLLRQPPPLNREQLLMLQEDNVGNAKPANELFGLKQRSFKEGISYVKRN